LLLSSLDLTNAAPQPASTSLAGTTHDLSLKTAYYTATVPVWIDLIASPAAWAESFLSPEAKEVLGVLGGLVLVFSLPATAAGSGAGENGSSQTKDLIRHFGRVVAEGLGGWEWDGVGLAVGVGEGDTEEWDDLCAGVGLEFVHFTGKQDQGTRNEFGGEYRRSALPAISPYPVFCSIMRPRHIRYGALRYG
jgi:alpha- and gamma-adaptin-binding protein p34